VFVGREDIMGELWVCRGDRGEGGVEGSSKGPKGFRFMRDEGMSMLGDGGEGFVETRGCDGVGRGCLLDDFFYLTRSHLFSGSSTFSFSFFFSIYW